MEFNESQKKKLDLLRNRVEDIMKPDFDDYFLSRWLEARHWDVKKAEKMLRENQIWRQKLGVDAIFDWNIPTVLKEYYSGGYHGVDKEGYPIWIDMLASTDHKGFFFSVTRKEMIKYKAYTTEYFYRELAAPQSKKLGKKIYQSTAIVDLEGIGLKQLWKPAVDMFVEQLTMMENNYPGGLKTCYIINAPAIFPLAFSLVMPFMSEKTRSTLRILGSNWKEQLLKVIDADQLPVHWGGTATDPDGDPYCRSKICMGGLIPEKYYRLKTFTDNNDLSTFTTTVVNRGSSLQLDFDIVVVGSLLRWNFLTEGKDIGFGVYRRTADKRQKADDMEEIVATGRVNSHMVPEAGSVQCDVTGVYVLRFDNTYSWLNAKRVSYLIEVVVPDAGMQREQCHGEGPASYETNMEGSSERETTAEAPSLFEINLKKPSAFEANAEGLSVFEINSEGPSSYQTTGEEYSAYDSQTDGPPAYKLNVEGLLADNTQGEETSVYEAEENRTAPYETKAERPSAFETKADGLSAYETKADGPSPYETDEDGSSPFDIKAEQTSTYKNKADENIAYQSKREGSSAYKVHVEGSSAYKIQTDGPSTCEVRAEGRSPYET